MSKRLTAEDWSEIRTLYETGGVPVGQLAERFDVSRTMIYRRIREEDWQQEVADRANRIAVSTLSKLSGLPAGQEMMHREQVIEREAEARAQVVLRQRNDWEAARPLLDEAVRILREPDYFPPDAKRGSFGPAARRKMAAEILKLYSAMANTFTNSQEAERRAYGIDLTLLTPKAPIEEELATRAKLISEVEALIRSNRAKVIEP